jgi:N-acetylgalactosamine-6-sulfatase
MKPSLKKCGRTAGRAWLAALVLLGAWLPFPGVEAFARELKPNVVFILADDLGYADVSCYGSSKIKTPHIDALAANGIKFKRYYDACAVCTPTRASLLTGRYPLRFGIVNAFPPKNRYLVREAVTLPQLLRPAGYVSAHVGKWHLGGLNLKDLGERKTGAPGPLEHGFDHYLCMNEEGNSRIRLVNQKVMYHEGAKYMLRDDQPVDLSPKHLTDLETDESIKYLEAFAASKQPFFLNVWFDVPHKPYEAATEEYVASYRNAAKDDDLLYRSMVAHLDGGVGRIVAALKRLGLTEDTLVIFSSDNGPTGPGDPGPWRGGKGTLFEGGIRVPFVVSWPGKIKIGQVNDDFAISTDFVPTICDAAGVKLQDNTKLDGQSLWPLIRGTGGAPARGDVFWMLSPYAGFQRERGEKAPWASEIVRRGDWKLMARNAQPIALFDLKTDPLERTNVLARHERLVAEMVPGLKAWLAEPRLIETSH